MTKAKCQTGPILFLRVTNARCLDKEKIKKGKIIGNNGVNAKSSAPSPCSFLPESTSNFFGNFSDVFLLDWHNKLINFHEMTRYAVLDLRLPLSLLSWPNPASKTPEIDIYLCCVGSMKFICC